MGAAAMAMLLAACSDNSDSGGGLSAAERASTTTIRVAPTSTESPTTAADQADTSDASPTTETSEATTTTVTVPPITDEWPELSFELVEVSRVAQPTALATRPGSPDLWVAERSGTVRRVERIGATTSDTFELVDEPVIDITDQVGVEGEGGLLGLTFSANGDLLYLHYTDVGGDNVVAEYPMNGDEAEASNQRVLLTVEQPFSNHNGGDITLGPDGLLYLSLGDGGASGDPELNGQDRTTLLGSILRIDPRPGQGTAYRVPTDNPFVDSAEGFRPEIWIWGARNPWRFSFDALTGDLWIADVGQNRLEEINFLPASAGSPGKGANLGWNLVEGNRPFADQDPPADHSPPLHVYDHDDGRCSVTGGYVYRGAAIAELGGVYLFGDFCGRRITGLARDTDGGITIADLVTDRSVENVIGFGQGPNGELFVLEQGGRVSLVQSS